MDSVKWRLLTKRSMVLVLLSLFFSLSGCHEVEEEPEPVTLEQIEESLPPQPPPPELTIQLFDDIPYGITYWAAFDLLGGQEEVHKETILIDDTPSGVRSYAVMWCTWRLDDVPNLAYRLGFIRDSLEKKEVTEWDDRFELK